MTKAIVRSVVLGIVLAVGSAAVGAGQAPQGPQPKTTPALADTYTAAEAALNAKRYPELVNKAKEILASPRKGPDDVYAANSYLLRAAQAQNDMAGMIGAMEAMLASGFNPGPGVQTQFRKALMSANYQSKNYAQALKHGKDLIAAGAADESVYTTVGQSYYQTRAYGDAVKLFGDMVAADEKAGRKPDRQQLSLLYSAYDKAGNADAAQATLEKMVRHYPEAKTWLVLLYEVKREKLDPRQRLALYRLMESTGNLKEAADIMAYYESAATLGLHNEAHRVLEAGLAAKAFAKAPPEEASRADRYVKSARTRADEARGELGGLATSAKSAATGDEFVALGMQQLSFDMYPQAVESLKAGMAKGGLKNGVDAQVNLGIAQFKAGQKAEAVKTFRAIEGADSITQRIVKFWTLHSQQ